VSSYAAGNTLVGKDISTLHRINGDDLSADIMLPTTISVASAALTVIEGYCGVNEK